MSMDIRCKIASTGSWTPYSDNSEALQALLKQTQTSEDKLKSPKPEVIPANERRRAPLPVKLAVETSLQAVRAISADPGSFSCVFVSGLGDTDLTDYMCKTLASEHKELSPTKFHNSVHNAPAGYWTISTKAMSAANSVAGYDYSVPLTLMDAMVQCQTEQKPVLVSFYDSPVSTVLQPVLKNRQAFAFSLTLYPIDSTTEGTEIGFALTEGSSEWQALKTGNDFLQSLYQQNPSARVLGLAEALFSEQAKAQKLVMPLNEFMTIHFQIGKPL